jgi:hypothetical protein
MYIYVFSVSLLTIVTEGRPFTNRVGDDLKLECKFHAERFDLFHYPVLWIKNQWNEESQINIMGNINDPFLSTDRYSVDYLEGSASWFTLELSIKSKDFYNLQAMLIFYSTDLKPEDSGNYTCQIRGPGSVILRNMTHTLYVVGKSHKIVIF